jgi:hypothetical protein
MAFGPKEGEGTRQQLKISFLALDSERLGEGVDDAMFQDFGDDCLHLYLPTKNKIKDPRKNEDSDTERENGEDDNDDNSSSGGGSSEDSSHHGIYSASTVSSANSDVSNDSGEEDVVISDVSDDDVSEEEVVVATDGEEEGNPPATKKQKEKQARLGQLFSPSVLQYLQYRDDDAT